MADTTFKPGAIDTEAKPVRRRLISHPVVILVSIVLSVATHRPAAIRAARCGGGDPAGQRPGDLSLHGAERHVDRVRGSASASCSSGPGPPGVERSHLRRAYLPEDETTILQAPELRHIYANARANYEAGGREGGFLPRLIQRVILQFRTSRSIEQANALLNSSLELYLHEIDLRYSMMRYVVWAIPTLGFIGTVIGISLALAFAGQVDVQDPTLLAELTKRLAVAFNTTLLALVMAAILVLIQHIVQAREEGALNEVGQYCLDNLINRLYEE